MEEFVGVILRADDLNEFHAFASRGFGLVKKVVTELYVYTEERRARMIASSKAQGEESLPLADMPSVPKDPSYGRVYHIHNL